MQNGKNSGLVMVVAGAGTRSLDCRVLRHRPAPISGGGRGQLDDPKNSGRSRPDDQKERGDGSRARPCTF